MPCSGGAQFGAQVHWPLCCSGLQGSAASGGRGAKAAAPQNCCETVARLLPGKSAWSLPCVGDPPARTTVLLDGVPVTRSPRTLRSHPLRQRRRAVRRPSPLAARLLRLAGKRGLWRQRFDRRPQRIDAQHLTGDGIDFGLQAFGCVPCVSADAPPAQAASAKTNAIVARCMVERPLPLV
jgi:hypothetical protein